MKSVLGDVNIPHWHQELRPREAAAMLGVSTGMVYLLSARGKTRPTSGVCERLFPLWQPKTQRTSSCACSAT